MAEPGRRRLPAWLGAAGAIAWVVAEVALVVWVAQGIGWWTIVLMAATSMLGAWLMLDEGARSLERLRDAVATGIQAPERAGSTGLTLLGGVLLILPGFLSDAVGLLLAIPLAQAPILRGLGAAMSGRASRATPARPDTVIIPGEVVDDVPDAPRPDHDGQDRPAQ